MRHVFTLATVLVLTTGLAFAQTPQTPQTPASGPTLQNPGLAGPDNATPPQPGANSFAEGQARKLIESKGYANVSPLVNDSQGIWHGTATKGQTKVEVSVDYKGHVNAK